MLAVECVLVVLAALGTGVSCWTFHVGARKSKLYGRSIALNQQAIAAFGQGKLEYGKMLRADADAFKAEADRLRYFHRAA